jgi:hypothetical protein
MCRRGGKGGRFLTAEHTLWGICLKTQDASFWSIRLESKFSGHLRWLLKWLPIVVVWPEATL